MSFEYINNYYKTPAKKGMRVMIENKIGTITSARGAHLLVKFDGEKHSGIHHPTWGVVYYGNNGEILMDCRKTRSLKSQPNLTASGKEDKEK
jgi:hypothetical protein